MRLIIMLGLMACRGDDRHDTGTDTPETDQDTNLSETDETPVDTGPFDEDQDGVFAAEDCDDGDAMVGAPSRHYPDADGDGHGDEEGGRETVCPGPGFALDNTDCDDNAADVFPGAPEVWCDGVDQDCTVLDDTREARFDGVVYPVAQDALDIAPDGSLVELCRSDLPLVVDHPVRIVSTASSPFINGGIQVTTDGDVTLAGLEFKGGESILVDGRPVGECLAVLGDANVVVEDSVFDCRLQGGGLYAAGGSTVTVRGTTFQFAKSSAILASGPLVVEDSTFSDNNGDAYDGAALSSSGPLTLNRVTFTSNSSMANGGALSYTGPGAVLTDVTFTSNHADGDGGALHASGPVELVRVTFDGNTADGGGAGFHHTGSSAALTEVTFTANVAQQNGGGAFLAGALNTLVDVAVDGNTAMGNGGGIWTASGMTTVTGGTFTGNTAVAGGAIALDGDGTWVGGTTATNVATKGGGGIDATGTWTISQVISTGDDGVVGDALEVTAGSVVTLVDSELWGKPFGTVVYVMDSQLYANDVLVSGPSSSGVYVISGGDAQLEDCTVDGMTGDGIVLTIDGSATVTNSVISNNDTGVLIRNTDLVRFTSIDSTYTNNVVDALPLSGDAYMSVDGTFTCDENACYD